MGLVIVITITTAIVKLEWFRGAITISFPTIFCGVCFTGIGGTGGVCLAQGTPTSCRVISVSAACGTAYSSRGSAPKLSLSFPGDYLRGSIHTHAIFRGILLQTHSRGKVIEKLTVFLILVTQLS